MGGEGPSIIITTLQGLYKDLIMLPKLHRDLIILLFLLLIIKYLQLETEKMVDWETDLKKMRKRRLKLKSRQKLLNWLADKDILLP